MKIFTHYNPKCLRHRNFFLLESSRRDWRHEELLRRHGRSLSGADNAQKRLDPPVSTPAPLQETVFVAYVGEAVEGVVGAGAGVELWRPAH